MNTEYTTKLDGGGVKERPSTTRLIDAGVIAIASLLLIVPAILRLNSSESTALNLFFYGSFANLIGLVVPVGTGIWLALNYDQPRVAAWCTSIFASLSVLSLFAFYATGSSCGCIPDVSMSPIVPAVLAASVSCLLAWRFVGKFTIASDSLRFLAHVFAMFAAQLLTCALNATANDSVPTTFYSQDVVVASRVIYGVRDSAKRDAIVVVRIRNGSLLPATIDAFVSNEPVRVLLQKSPIIGPGRYYDIPVCVSPTGLSRDSFVVQFSGHQPSPYNASALIHF